MPDLFIQHAMVMCTDLILELVLDSKIRGGHTLSNPKGLVIQFREVMRIKPFGFSH